jgi:hypothetical protein
MSELPRRIVSRLRRYIGNRRRTKRARVRLSFTLSLADPRTSSNGSRRLPSLEGHTLDVSTDGVGLLVPAIRIGEHYLVGNERKLHLKLDLPDGLIELNVVPVRYESLEEDASDSGYVIGARIIEISDSDRIRLDQFVSGWFAKQAGG